MNKDIVIKFEHPPIGDRNSDYRAYRKGTEENNICGWGMTPIIALRELLDLEEAK